MSETAKPFCSIFVSEKRGCELSLELGDATLSVKIKSLDALKCVESLANWRRRLKDVKRMYIVLGRLLRLNAPQSSTHDLDLKCDLERSKKNYRYAKYLGQRTFC